MTWATCSAGAVRSSPEPTILRGAATPSAPSAAFTAPRGAAGGGHQPEAMGQGATAHLELSQLAGGWLDGRRRHHWRCPQRRRHSLGPARARVGATTAPAGAPQPWQRAADGQRWEHSSSASERGMGRRTSKAIGMGWSSPSRRRTGSNGLGAVPRDPKGISNPASPISQNDSRRARQHNECRRLGNLPER